ncbi:hypothetical protein LOAG_05270 [Loa loa]|uniref:Uncharacterized protein n=1 Tax=Loa loa TaxID=7209 RepID=A0A1I7V8M3_LOALO|nr:hypothetical protein LOAG_05270 [Loa loa]EFO23214.2 hypothetical protein LOAG_05270 [Loa loa]
MARMSKRRSDEFEPKAGCSKDRGTMIGQTGNDDSGDVEGAGSSCKKIKYMTPVEEWPSQLFGETWRFPLRNLDYGCAYQLFCHLQPSLRLRELQCVRVVFLDVGVADVL